MRRISRKARAFLLKCGETHLAACSKHREEIKQGWMQGQNSAYTGVLYMWCYTCTGNYLQFLEKSFLLTSVSYSGVMKTQLSQKPSLFGASGHLALGFNELSCEFSSAASQ